MEFLLAKYYFISKKTKKSILNPFRESVINTESQQREWIRDNHGVFRFLPKLHKNKTPMPLRKVEVDTRNPFGNLATYTCDILNGIAARCNTVLLDSKALVATFSSDTFPMSASPHSADLVDYFERTDIFYLRKTLHRYVSEDFAGNIAHVVSRMVDIVIQMKFFRVKGVWLWKKSILNPFHASVINTESQQREWIHDNHGVFRFLPKLHKNKTPMPLRKVEVDTRNPFGNLATYTCDILNGIAARCNTVLLDSKALVATFSSDTFPMSASPHSADLVDYFERTDIFYLRKTLHRYVSEDFAGNIAHVVSRMVDIVIQMKFFRVKGVWLWKKASLSIEETTATAAANILRHDATKGVIEKYKNHLLYFHGYVDDSFFIWHSTHDVNGSVTIMVSSGSCPSYTKTRHQCLFEK